MFTFFRLPKCLVNNVYFAELSADAKLLYAFFLDRVSLSIKNGWIDDKGRVFIYYSVKRVCKDLNCGTQKACKLLDELEKAGALERKRDIHTGKNQKRRGVKITSRNFDLCTHRVLILTYLEL